MNKKAIIMLTAALLAVCLIGGSCSSSADKKADIKDWRDLLSLAPEKSSPPPSAEKGKRDQTLKNPETAGRDLIRVKLYFIGADGKSLVVEERNIARTESLARSTLKELLKGPAKPENLPAIPEGTRLRDINLKPDGLCIVDLSSEACRSGSAEQEKLMVYAVANTLGQFATVKNISFMIDGQNVETITGFVDVSSSIKPDYSI